MNTLARAVGSAILSAIVTLAAGTFASAEGPPLPTAASQPASAAVEEIKSVLQHAIEMEDDGRISDAIQLLGHLTERFASNRDPAVESALGEVVSTEFTMLVRVGDYAQASRLLNESIDRAMASGKSFSQEELASARAVANPERWQASYVQVSRQRGPIGLVLFGFHPAATDADKRFDQLSKEESTSGDQFMRWGDFRQHVREYIRAAVIRNDYPQYDLADGISCLVQHDPNYWGVTWNGGILIGHTGRKGQQEEQWVTKRYEAYRRDPTAYRPISDPDADPVNPAKYLRQWRCLPSGKQPSPR